MWTQRIGAGTFAAALGLTIGALAGCGDDTDSDASGTAAGDTVTTPSSSATPPEPTPPTDSGPGSTAPPGAGDEADEALDAAVTDLAERRDVDAGDITVVSDARVTWRDGSLGCPEPGKMYTQALVPGRRVILRAGGRDHAYHGGRDGPLAYCADPAADGTAPDGGDT